MTNDLKNIDQQPLRFIIAGGGTGGHIFPAIAIANAIKALQPAATFLFVGAKGKMEMEKVPQAGYDIQGLDITGFNRSSIIKNLALPFKLLKSFLQVKGILSGFKPDAVIGVGGYSSFPVLRVAQAKGIPTFIHESNSFAGKSNMMLAKKATRVFVASDGMEKFFPKEKITVTGNPVRKSISEITCTKEASLAFFNLKADKKVLLSIGGSLGAKNINEALISNLELISSAGLQLLWQTGKPFYAEAMKAAEQYDNVRVYDFIKDMDQAYTAADFIISRSGAMAVAELCLVKKPVVFVPYPYAAEDHQTVNAMNLVNKEAAIIVANNTTLTSLVTEAIQLSKDEIKQEELIQNMSPLGIPNADEIIANNILSSIKTSKN